MTSQLLPLFCVVTVLSSLLGGALPLATRLSHTRLQIYLSFAAGSMLGAAFFHMLPEAVEIGSSGVLRWCAGGLLAIFFLERWFAFHHHEAPSDPSDPCPSHPHEHERGPGHAAGVLTVDAVGTGGSPAKGANLQWGVAAFGLAVHTITGGVAMASASMAPSRATALSVFLATVVHKPADSLTIVSLMLRAGVASRTAHLVNLGFSLLLPLGAALFVVSTKWSGSIEAETLTASALAFSAGTFLCISLSDLLPELQFHSHDRLPLSAALLLGFGLMAGASWWG